MQVRTKNLRQRTDLGTLQLEWMETKKDFFLNQPSHPKYNITRLGCFYVTAMLSWDWSWCWFEFEVEVRLNWGWGWEWGWYEVKLKFCWSWLDLGLSWVGFELKLSWVGVKLSWGWVELGLCWVGVVLSSGFVELRLNYSQNLAFIGLEFLFKNIIQVYSYSRRTFVFYVSFNSYF